MRKRIDVDFVALYFRDFSLALSVMPTELRGPYCSLIFKIYDEGGWLPLDKAYLADVCGLTELEFDKIWRRLKAKFVTKKTRIYHKRCRRELEVAYAKSQAPKVAGLKGAQKRWHPNGGLIASHKRPNGNENETRTRRREDINTVTKENPPFVPDTSRKRIGEVWKLSKAISMIMPVKDNSDRSCCDNIAKWLSDTYATDDLFHRLSKRLLQYCEEAVKKAKRNKWGYLYDVLKRDIDIAYDAKRENNKKKRG